MLTTKKILRQNPTQPFFSQIPFFFFIPTNQNLKKVQNLQLGLPLPLKEKKEKKKDKK